MQASNGTALFLTLLLVADASGSEAGIHTASVAFRAGGVSDAHTASDPGRKGQKSG
jgi:hypothetical protein